MTKSFKVFKEKKIMRDGKRFLRIQKIFLSFFFFFFAKTILKTRKINTEDDSLLS
jgi:hypothetical protein